MKLNDILKNVEGVHVNGDSEIQVTNITSDSRQIK